MPATKQLPDMRGADVRGALVCQDQLWFQYGAYPFALHLLILQNVSKPQQIVQVKSS